MLREVNDDDEGIVGYDIEEGKLMHADTICIIHNPSLDFNPPLLLFDVGERVDPVLGHAFKFCFCLLSNGFARSLVFLYFF
jgi:hypothetical protein